MWGTSFADLAKIASEQAAEYAKSQQLFNLDGLQAVVGADDEDEENELLAEPTSGERIVTESPSSLEDGNGAAVSGAIEDGGGGGKSEDDVKVTEKKQSIVDESAVNGDGIKAEGNEESAPVIDEQMSNSISANQNGTIEDKKIAPIDENDDADDETQRLESMASIPLDDETTPSPDDDDKEESNDVDVASVEPSIPHAHPMHRGSTLSSSSGNVIDNGGGESSSHPPLGAAPIAPSDDQQSSPDQKSPDQKPPVAAAAMPSMKSMIASQVQLFASNDVNALEEQQSVDNTTLTSVDDDDDENNTTLTSEVGVEDDDEGDDGWADDDFGNGFDDEQAPVVELESTTTPPQTTVIVTPSVPAAVTEVSEEAARTEELPVANEGTNDDEDDDDTPLASTRQHKQETSSNETKKKEVPEEVIQQFMSQIQRIDEHHQEEFKNMTASYEKKISYLEEKLVAALAVEKMVVDEGVDAMTGTAAVVVEAPKLAAVHEEYKLKLARMEEKYEGMLEKQMDDLERLETENGELLTEVDGLRKHKAATAEKLGHLQKSVASIHEDQKQKIGKLESQVSDLQGELGSCTVQVQELESSLATATSEKQEAITQYENLKSRVKIVATELKERRQECRELNTHVNTLQSENALLKTAKDTFQKDLEQLKKSHENDDVERMELRDTLTKTQSDLQSVTQQLASKESVTEKTLLAYKKKAQAALGLANARAATAQAARDEMEMEVQTSKNAAVEAEERARVAETQQFKIVKNVEEERRVWEKEKVMLETEREQGRKKAEEMEERIETLDRDLGETLESHRRLEEEVATLEEDFKKEASKTCDLTTELSAEKSLSADLERRLEIARLEHERSAAAAFFAKQKEMQKEDQEKLTSERGGRPQNTEADGTIALLQEELDGANEAIKELKEALKGALLANTSSDTNSSSYDTSNHLLSLSSTQAAHSSNKTNSSTPLFFALEKQAELQSAQDEIYRLANLLSDAETSKNDAYENMNKMRQKMEDAEARLKRYEKLGHSQATNTHNSLTSATSSFLSSSSRRHIGGAAAAGDTDGPNTFNASLNLEYLKNVTLRYLRAQTLSEKRALVPVLSAVLCLTEEERNEARRAVESSGGLQAVGSTFIEAVETANFSSLFS
eukprot:CAMPEP_0172500828 /NCGR_PEP_ID=MMETSP1066-20121228/143555_1 /TAXON_ID=671091 /ORGANISM="Coscinodiscus wailesii, Strain CCMP2513" /LENGTH=1135 /DNA_ID=CAMNT_0013275295 /DNA_START=126 /DNA_END=3533 /DNA_ORIENTATION=+